VSGTLYDTPATSLTHPLPCVLGLRSRARYFVLYAVSTLPHVSVAAEVGDARHVDTLDVKPMDTTSNVPESHGLEFVHDGTCEGLREEVRLVSCYEDKRRSAAVHDPGGLAQRISGVHMLQGTHDVLEVVGDMSVRLFRSSHRNVTGELHKSVEKIMMPISYHGGGHSTQPVAYGFHTLKKIDVCSVCSN
jgi:hypothetical protein